MVKYSVQSRPGGVYWSSRVRVLCVSVSAASAHPHHPCGTTFRQNWRTATLVDRGLNLALRHGRLGVPTRNRHLSELLFKGRYINPRDGPIPWNGEWEW